MPDNNMTMERDVQSASPVGAAARDRRLGLGDSIRVHICAFFAQLLIRCVGVTLRWKFVGFDGDGARWTAQEPCILSFWHGHQVFMPKIYLHFKLDDTRPILPLISEHGDGRIAALTLRWFGIDS